jgi:hypothetical protein
MLSDAIGSHPLQAQLAVAIEQGIITDSYSYSSHTHCHAYMGGLPDH